MTRAVAKPCAARDPWPVRVARRSTAALLRLFRVRESRERVARGLALGLVVNFLPSFGFGVLISGFFARVLGGNLLAGLVGGASLTFAWPLLFYANIRVGALFVRPPRVLDDLGDVTDETVGALVWGQTFAVGSMVNIATVGLLVYVVALTVYNPIRPIAVRSLRHAAVRLRRRRLARVTGGAVGLED